MARCFVKSIQMINFLTYSDSTIDLAQGLNIIYGPNGSGKSSIVCALCLVLGKDHKILHRSTNIRDFIKTGETEGKVVIKICSNSMQHEIVRTFSVSKTISKWYLNNQKVSHEMVINLVNELKINVDNICNFLPQDRVSDFFKMNPQELLVALEESIDDGELRSFHNKLIEIQQEISQKKSAIKAKEKEIERLDNQYQWIQDDFQKYEEWVSNQNLLMVAEKKITWMKYAIFMKEYQDICTNLASLEKEYDSIESSASSSIEGNNEINTQKKSLEKNMKINYTKMANKCEKIKKIKQYHNDMINKIKPMKERIQGIISEKDASTESIEVRYKQIENIKTSIATLQNKYDEQLPLIAETNHKIDIEKKSLADLNTKIFKENAELSKLNESQGEINHKIQKLNEFDQRYLNILRRYDPDAFKAYEILKEGRIRFKSTVYTPLFLHINVLNPEDRRYFENHISKRDLFAFLVDNHNDMHLFLREFRENRNLKISCLLVNSSQMTPRKLIIPQNLQLKSYMIDLINVPPLVQSFLIQSYHIDTIPIFDRLSESDFKQLLTVHSIKSFFTYSEKYTINISKYSNKPMVNSFTLKLPKESMFKSFDSSLRRDLETKIDELNHQMKLINNDLLHLEQNKRSIEDKIELLNRNLREASECKSSISFLEGKITTRQNEIQKCTESIRLSEKRLIEERNALKEVYHSFKPSFKQLAAYIQKMSLLVDKSCSYQLEEMYIDNKIKTYQQYMESVQEELRMVKLNIDRVKNEKNQKKQKAKDLLACAKEISGIASPEAVISDELKKEFDQLPDNYDELVAKATELRALVEASSNTFLENVAGKFEEVKSKMTSIMTNVNNHRALLDDNLRNETNIKTKWLNRLNAAISVISSSFSIFFEKIKAKGHIELIADPELEYSKYAIGIMVSYRVDEPTIRLSNTRHSGGEKAVATMLFLMAIQQLSVSPFKVVDEINQGMDCMNEKTVFQIMVETISKLSESTQYLFLSPKVLPDLAYDSNMTIHTICGGRAVIPQSNQEILNDRSNISQK